MKTIAARISRTALSTLACTTLISLGAAAAHAAIGIEEVVFDSLDGTELTGVVYTPDGFDTDADETVPAVVLLHGCTGIWSYRNVGATNDNGTPDLQNHLEKWGKKLAAAGYVALVVDSYTPRYPANIAKPPTSSDWQNQCSGAANAGKVDPYTTRVLDARGAYDFLTSDTEFAAVNPLEVGMLGWSQGAQTAMVEIGDRDRLAPFDSREDELRFSTTVVFYPGCGANLGFDAPDASVWHPYADFRMNMGDLDDLYGDCDDRMEDAIAINTDPGAPTIAYEVYDDAEHSFDAKSQTWPTSTCTSPSNGDVCAMKDADLDSFSFFETHLK